MKAIKSRAWRTWAVAVVVLSVGTACADGDPTSDGGTGGASETTSEPGDTDSPTDTGTNVAAGGDVTLPAGTYQIAASEPMSGQVAYYGADVEEAYEFALKQANEAERFGPGVTLELVMEDNAADQARTISAVDSILSNDDFAVMFCCGLSPNTLAAIPQIDGAGMPTVISSAIATGATDSPNVFRMKPPANTLYRALGPAVVGALGIETAVVTRTSDNDAMVESAGIMIEELENLGVEVTVVDLLSDQTDVSGPATQIVGMDPRPDAVFHMELGETLALHVRELHDRGYEGVQPGTNQMGDPEQWEQAGEALVGHPFASPFHARSDIPFVQEFTAEWNAEFGEDPGVFHGEAYTAALFVLESLELAVEGAGGNWPTREQMLDAMTAVETVESPLGAVMVDESGQGDIDPDDVPFLQWNSDGVVVSWDGTAEGLLERS